MDTTFEYYSSKQTPFVSLFLLFSSGEHGKKKKTEKEKKKEQQLRIIFFPINLLERQNSLGRFTGLKVRK